jgi:hypothetical protein
MITCSQQPGSAGKTLPSESSVEPHAGNSRRNQAAPLCGFSSNFLRERVPRAARSANVSTFSRFVLLRIAQAARRRSAARKSA